ncbi:MAG: L-aspartate oxidase [Planctomycetota bacterium]
MPELPETALPRDRGSPRYVFPFRPKQLASLRWPVVVLGCGAAGSAVALAAADAGVEVLMLEKPPAGESNSSLAQGGIAAVVADGDSLERHCQDTLRVGCGLCEPAMVSMVVGAGPEAIGWLEGLGVRFDQSGGERRGLSREGGHSFPRVLSANGDSTGKAIQSRLEAAIGAQPRVTVRRNLRAVDLLVSEGRCIGLLALGLHEELLMILSGMTVVATGGGGQIFRETTNPNVATADGLAMAYRAGATLRDLEFVQFHPTTLYIAGAARVLITEALRGAGAVLVDRTGERVMKGRHPDDDLAPRDVVSRCILRRMVETKDTHVYLDASRVDGDVRQLFPGIARMCAAFGLDISKDPIPVRPGAHYMVGGIRTQTDCSTDLPGLLACGEAASTGLHGANRLASNSLLEALVAGRIAGQQAAERAHGPDDRGLRNLDANPEHGLDRLQAPEVRLNLDDMLYSMKALMWRQAGLMREEFMLDDAVKKIRFWERALHGQADREPKYIDLANMLLVSRLLCSAALFRQESRGTHYRLDHRDRDDERWLRHLILKRAHQEELH